MCESNSLVANCIHSRWLHSCTDRNDPLDRNKVDNSFLFVLLFCFTIYLPFWMNAFWFGDFLLAVANFRFAKLTPASLTVFGSIASPVRTAVRRGSAQAPSASDPLVLLSCWLSNAIAETFGATLSASKKRTWAAGDGGGAREDEPSVRPLWEDRLPHGESQLPGQGEPFTHGGRPGGRGSRLKGLTAMRWRWTFGVELGA